jgi:DNA-binding transcriptional ArsR family regulator
MRESMAAASNGKKVQPCRAKASLQDRSLITTKQALALEGLFGVLANDTRLRLLHEIARHDEVCVGDLAEALEMKPQAVSNQLQRLLDKTIVAARRDGNNVYYRILDGCVMVLLERGLCLIEETMKRLKN